MFRRKVEKRNKKSQNKPRKNEKTKKGEKQKNKHQKFRVVSTLTFNHFSETDNRPSMYIRVHS